MYASENQAILLTPVNHLQGAHCLRFHLHMRRTVHAGALRVFISHVTDEGVLPHQVDIVNRTTVFLVSICLEFIVVFDVNLTSDWHKNPKPHTCCSMSFSAHAQSTEKTGDKWYREYVNLPPGDYVIGFEAIATSGERNPGIALDDVELIAGTCQGQGQLYFFIMNYSFLVYRLDRETTVGQHIKMHTIKRMINIYFSSVTLMSTESRSSTLFLFIQTCYCWNA